MKTLREAIRDHIILVLAFHKGHVTNTAKDLGISRGSLYYRIKEFGIEIRKTWPEYSGVQKELPKENIKYSE